LEGDNNELERGREEMLNEEEKGGNTVNEAIEETGD